MTKRVVASVLLMIMLLSGTTYGVSHETPIDKVVINIPSKTLVFYQGDSSKTYPVAVGKANTQTPLGSFTVINKLLNPYYSKKKIPGGRADNPLGVRWMGFKNNYGIHGNSAPQSIGTLASAGCVRMFNYDVKELYEKVQKGTKVEVIYNLFDLRQLDNFTKKVLIIYPDVYKKQKNIRDAIIKKLEEVNMMNEKLEAKLDEVVKITKGKAAALSESWTLIINQHYFSTEILKEGDEFYIGENILRDYFGLIPSELDEETIVVQDVKMSYRWVQNQRYIPISGLQTILGGSIDTNDVIENFWYDVSFIKLNGVFLEGNHSKLVTHEPSISVEKLETIFSNSINDKKADRYMSLEEIQKNYGISYDINAIDNRIELYTTPTVQINEKNIPCIQQGEKLYILRKDIGLLEGVLKEEIIEIEELSYRYDIIRDTYKTKVILQEKKTIITEADSFLEENRI